MWLARVLLVLAVLFGVAIALGYSTWWPLRVDGGWYSYPGYALSEGRDPGENMLQPEQLPLDRPGVRSVFHWENRSFLITRVYAYWFELAGHGATSLAILGVLQWLALTVLVGMIVWRLTRNRVAAIGAAIFTLSDSIVIRECMSDMRPDMPIGVVALASLWFLAGYFESRRLLDLVLCAVLLQLLPLLHTTGVLPEAMLLASLMLFVLAPWPVGGAQAGRSRDLGAASLVVIASLALFALRQPVLDLLVPTHVPLAVEKLGRHDLIETVRAMVGRGLGAKLDEEWQRWKGYFFPANAAHLVFLVGGLATLASTAVRRGPSGRMQLCLVLGWLAGVICLTLTDSHSTFAHLLALTCLGYAVAGSGWALWLATGAEGSARLVRVLASIGALAVVLKIAQFENIVNKGTHEGVTRDAIAQLLDRALPGDGVTWVVGPTSVWPLVPERGTPILVDRREDPQVLDSPIGQRVSVLIVDSDFLEFGWGAVVAKGVKDGTLTSLGQVGRVDGGIYYIEAFSVHHGAAQAAAPAATASSAGAANGPSIGPAR